MCVGTCNLSKIECIDNHFILTGKGWFNKAVLCGVGPKPKLAKVLGDNKGPFGGWLVSPISSSFKLARFHPYKSRGGSSDLFDFQLFPLPPQTMPEERRILMPLLALKFIETMSTNSLEKPLPAWTFENCSVPCSLPTKPSIPNVQQTNAKLSSLQIQSSTRLISGPKKE